MSIYRITSKLTVPECLREIEELLAYENVEFNKAGCAIKSQTMPIAILGTDRRMYSKANWIGINPFIFLSGIEIICSETEHGTNIEICIDRRRSRIMYAFLMINVFVVAYALPNPIAGGLLFIICAFMFYFVMIRYFGGRLIRNEIRDKLSGTK